MARPKRQGTKYDSFSEKIADYQMRKTLWLEKHWEEKAPDKFQDDYNALTQLKRDAKERIEEHLDGALLFSRIVQYGTLPRSPYNSAPYVDLVKNNKLADYTLLNKDKEVRKKMENETQEFIADIFNKDRMEKILDAIFFGPYNEPLEKNHERYRIIIAEMMMQYATVTLQRHTESFLFGQLRNAMEVATFIKKQNTS